MAPHTDQFQTFNIKTRQSEGGYIDNPKRIDQPTNSGITEPTLKQYNQMHPDLHFPRTVKNLTSDQIDKIYHELFFQNRKIHEIKNHRIAYAIYDMGVMSNFKNVIKIVQSALNEFMTTHITVDGILGRETVCALNNISPDNIDVFMDKLKSRRLHYLAGLKDWPKYGRGWTSRTNKY